MASPISQNSGNPLFDLFSNLNLENGAQEGGLLNNQKMPSEFAMAFTQALEAMPQKQTVETMTAEQRDVLANALLLSAYELDNAARNVASSVVPYSVSQTQLENFAAGTQNHAQSEIDKLEQALRAFALHTEPQRTDGGVELDPKATFPFKPYSIAPVTKFRDTTLDNGLLAAQIEAEKIKRENEILKNAIAFAAAQSLGPKLSLQTPVMMPQTQELPTNDLKSRMLQNPIWAQEAAHTEVDTTTLAALKKDLQAMGMDVEVSFQDVTSEALPHHSQSEVLFADSTKPLEQGFTSKPVNHQLSAFLTQPKNETEVSNLAQSQEVEASQNSVVNLQSEAHQKAQIEFPRMSLPSERNPNLAMHRILDKKVDAQIESAIEKFSEEKAIESEIRKMMNTQTTQAVRAVPSGDAAISSGLLMAHDRLSKVEETSEKETELFDKEVFQESNSSDSLRTLESNGSKTWVGAAEMKSSESSKTDSNQLSQVALERARNMATQLQGRGGTAKVQLRDSNAGNVSLQIRVEPGNKVFIEVSASDAGGKLKEDFKEGVEQLKKSLESQKLTLSEFKFTDTGFGSSTNSGSSQSNRENSAQEQRNNSQSQQGWSGQGTSQGGQNSSGQGQRAFQDFGLEQIAQQNSRTRGFERSTAATNNRQTNVQRNANGSLKVSA